MSAQSVILLFTLFIYILIIVVFNKAKTKYYGGKIGDVLRLILITVILLFASDYIQLFRPYISENIIITLQSLFKTVALSLLAFGGSKISNT